MRCPVVLDVDKSVGATQGHIEPATALDDHVSRTEPLCGCRLTIVIPVQVTLHDQSPNIKAGIHEQCHARGYEAEIGRTALLLSSLSGHGTRRCHESHLGQWCRHGALRCAG